MYTYTVRGTTYCQGMLSVDTLMGQNVGQNDFNSKLNFRCIIDQLDKMVEIHLETQKLISKLSEEKEEFVQRTTTTQQTASALIVNTNSSIHCSQVLRTCTTWYLSTWYQV
jgi:hypothetical protein